MDIANNNKQLVSIFKQINACRFYLKTQYLSDITKISGKALTQGVLSGYISTLPSSKF